MKLLTEEEVRQCLTPWAAINASKEAFLSLERRIAIVPQRSLVSTPEDSITLFKPGYIPGQSLGLKVIGVRPANAAAGLPTTPAVVLLFAEDNGLPLACMPASYLTALRTAAGSAIASDLCASPTANCLVVFGAGLQAEAHILTHFCVRDIRRVVVVNRHRARAHQLVEQVKKVLKELVRVHGDKDVGKGDVGGEKRLRTKEEPMFVVLESGELDRVRNALKEADIVCTTTAAPAPLFDGNVSDVGYMW